MMKKINEFLDVEETKQLAKELDEETAKLKERIQDEFTACLADIDPDVLKERINLVMAQCFLQAFAVMKLTVAEVSSEHEDEDIEFLLTRMIQSIQGYTETMVTNCKSAEIDVQLAEEAFDHLLDELEE